MSSSQTSPEIARVFAEVGDPAVMVQLFSELLTDAERHDLALRWELLKLLRDGVPQREIASKLHVSLCKITRGAKILKDEHSVVRRILANHP